MVKIICSVYYLRKNNLSVLKTVLVWGQERGVRGAYQYCAVSETIESEWNMISQLTGREGQNHRITSTRPEKMNFLCISIPHSFNHFNDCLFLINKRILADNQVKKYTSSLTRNTLHYYKMEKGAFINNNNNKKRRKMVLLRFFTIMGALSAIYKFHRSIVLLQARCWVNCHKKYQ